MLSAMNRTREWGSGRLARRAHRPVTTGRLPRQIAWAERVGEERERRRTDAERLRIARELHDVVAYGFAAISLQDVQDYISMSDHQANSNLVIIGGDAWTGLDQEQQTALEDAVAAAEEQVPGCVAEDEEKTLAEWEESGDMEVVDDVDVETFRSQADTYLRENFNADQLAIYEGIRNEAQ